MYYNCAVQLQQWTVPFILISLLIYGIFSTDPHFVNLVKLETNIDKTFEKLKNLQKNKLFLLYKLEGAIACANELDDKNAMLKIEVSNLPNIQHSDIFKITKKIARDWGVFNENDIADMYVFSKRHDKTDKNIIIGFKTMKAKRKWLSCYKNGALSQGLKSLNGYKGVMVKYTPLDGNVLRFNVKMLDHVSRYKAFLLSICLGRAKTINKLNRYRFWVNNSEIFGVYRNMEESGYYLRYFNIDCFDDISREVV